MRRAALIFAAGLALAASGCDGGGGGGADEPSSGQAPQALADGFVAELLDGRPADAANRLNPIRAELEPQLPGLSITLQENEFRVVDTKRRGDKAFIYEFEGKNASKASWLLTMEMDVGQWGVVDFGPANRPPPPA